MTSQPQSLSKIDRTNETANAPMRWLRKNWFWLLVNLLALVPLLRFMSMMRAAPMLNDIVLFRSETTTDILLFTGQASLVLLILSLACTPAARIVNFRRASSVRKSLGLWGFGYGLLHGVYYLNGTALFKGQAQWSDIERTLDFGWRHLTGMTKAPYAAAGIVALLLLVPLALTSNRLSMRWLGKGWKRLHMLVYLAVPSAVYHYWCRADSNFVKDADYFWPLLYAVVLALLLALRLPPVRTSLVKLFRRSRPN